MFFAKEKRVEIICTSNDGEGRDQLFSVIIGRIRWGSRLDGSSSSEEALFGGRVKKVFAVSASRSWCLLICVVQLPPLRTAAFRDEVIPRTLFHPAIDLDDFPRLGNIKVAHCGKHWESLRDGWNTVSGWWLSRSREDAYVIIVQYSIAEDFTRYPSVCLV